MLARKILTAGLGFALVSVAVWGALLTVAGPATAAPWTGPEPTPTNLTVFLHNSTTALPISAGIFSNTVLTTTSDSTPPWLGQGRVDTGVHYLTVPFYLFPRLAGPLVLNGTPTANIYVNQTGSTTSGAWQLALYAISPTGGATLLGTPGKTSYSSGYNGNLGLPLRITYGSTVQLTLGAGWSVAANFSQVQGATSDGYGFWWGDVGGSYYASDFNLPASSYLDIHPAFLIGPNGTPVTNLNTSVATPVVSLRANVTDPLGNYDYDNWTVAWSVTNATGVVEGNGTMAPFGPEIPPLGVGFNETYAAAYNYSGLANGAYNFCANASDNSYHNDLLFTGGYYGRIAGACTSFSVGLGPNLVRLAVTDSVGKPLHGAVVSLGGIVNATNLTGVVDYHLVNGTYTGQVMWEGVPAGSFPITVSGPTVYTLTAGVYYPTFAIEDHNGAALSDAFVYIVHPNGTHYPLIVTNATANISLPQVPGGAWGITVIWHDSVVYSQPAQPAISVDRNAVYAIETQVYTQAFRVVEPSGTPIPLASVVVQNSSTGVLISFGITNASGETSSRVPAGSFTILVYWQANVVATVSSLTLPASTNPFVISASLFTVTLTAVDGSGIPVAGALIGVTGLGGGPITNLLTNGTGGATLVLPGGTYTLVTIWEGVVVDSTTVVVNSSEHLTLDLAIYYLSVNSVDSSGAVLAGALLEVLSNPTTSVVDSAVSTGQPTVFRLPVGTYYVVATYKTTYDLTPIEQTLNQSVVLSSSQNLTLTFSQVYPAFTSTSEFYVILGYVLLAVLLAALLLLTFRRRRKGNLRTVSSASGSATGSGTNPPSSTTDTTQAEGKEDSPGPDR